MLRQAAISFQGQCGLCQLALFVLPTETKVFTKYAHFHRSVHCCIYLVRVVVSSERRELLDYLRHDVSFVKAFHAYCKRNLCSENLEFWLQAEAYLTSEADDVVRVAEAKAICAKFISDAGELQISLPEQISTSVLNSVDEGSLDIFQEAQAHVLNNMKEDSFSPLYSFRGTLQISKCL